MVSSPAGKSLPSTPRCSTAGRSQAGSRPGRLRARTDSGVDGTPPSRRSDRARRRAGSMAGAQRGSQPESASGCDRSGLGHPRQLPLLRLPGRGGLEARQEARSSIKRPALHEPTPLTRSAWLARERRLWSKQKPLYPVHLVGRTSRPNATCSDGSRTRTKTLSSETARRCGRASAPRGVGSCR